MNSEPTAPSLPASSEDNALSRVGEILVIDDMSTIRIMLSHHLRALGHHVTGAASGREGLELLRNQHFDLVLLDVMMPEMDGYAVLKEIKFDRRLRSIPVLMISSTGEMQDVVQCIEYGAEDYLPKPFNLTLLKARVGASLEKKRLWDELTEQHQQLQELEKLRDSLTSMIVHDLRTPLTSFLAGLQSVGDFGEMNTDQQEFLDIAIEGGHTLLGMINDLLDVSKMEQGAIRLNYQKIGAQTLIAEALLQVRHLAHENSILLVPEVTPDLPPLMADEDLLRRTLVNLLGNALKFTPTGGKVTISARLNAPHEAILFAVSDTGEGIPQESFERIFEKFGQVESRKAGRKMSTGLGLTFCKMAVKAHKGQIWAESQVGVGSTFSFTIPTRF